MIKTIISSTIEFISNVYFIHTILIPTNIYLHLITYIIPTIYYKNDSISI